MLPRVNRITENREFLKIFKTVRPYYTEHLVLRAAKRMPNNQSSITNKIPNSNKQKGIAAPSTMGMARNDKGCLQPRFGFVISNKIDKRSARRNGLKRRIRAVVEQKLPEIAGGIDVVIQVKKPYDYPYDYEAIEKETLEGLKRTGVLK